MNYYVENDAAITEKALFIPLSDAQKTTAQEALASLGS